VASLSSEGVSVLESVDSADAAYESITRTRPDVAVLDSLLPGGPILELCQRLRLEQPGVAVILHAGIVTVQFLRAAERAGAALVVPKSIVDGQLARSVLALGRGTSLAP
jgi:DNA-binding NarL/FixJ family response regulator